MTGAPRRLARRRGFGIHSPFAFDFVRRVLAQPCRYYAYDRLSAAARRDGISPRIIRLIFRLALHFRPAAYCVEGRGAEAFDLAVTLGAPKAETDSRRATFVIINPDRPISLPPTSEGSAGDTVVVLLHPSSNSDLLSGLWHKMNNAMLFRGSSVAVIVSRNGLPRQMFNVWI